MKEYQVAKYRRLAEGWDHFLGFVSGHGKNKGTWDSNHSRSSAYRLKKELEQQVKEDDPNIFYKVEEA